MRLPNLSAAVRRDVPSAVRPFPGIRPSGIMRPETCGGVCVKGGACANPACTCQCQLSARDGSGTCRCVNASQVKCPGPGWTGSCHWWPYR
jgi:hypothetical protein